jgi:hypothetical protein
MSVNRYWIPISLIVAMLGTVFSAQVLGWWSISGRTSVNLEQLTPADIKGWMTLQEVADGLNLPIEDIYRIGGIPADIAPDMALKDLEEVVEVSTLREALDEYITEDTPAEPVSEPTAQAPADTVHIGSGDGTGTGLTPPPPGQILPADQIKGRMTLREVSDQCAVDLDDLLAALNLPADTDLDTQLKTLTEEGSLDEITQVQEAVAALQE